MVEGADFLDSVDLGDPNMAHSPTEPHTPLDLPFNHTITPLPGISVVGVTEPDHGLPPEEILDYIHTRIYERWVQKLKDLGLDKLPIIEDVQGALSLLESSWDRYQNLRLSCSAEELEQFKADMLNVLRRSQACIPQVTEWHAKIVSLAAEIQPWAARDMHDFPLDFDEEYQGGHEITSQATMCEVGVLRLRETAVMILLALRDHEVLKRWNHNGLQVLSDNISKSAT